MPPQEEIQQLKQRVQFLENIVLSFVRSDRFDMSKNIQMQDGRNIQLATGTGSKIGTLGGASGQKLGFFNNVPVVQQISAANLTNNVTSGGDNDIIANFTDLTTYSNSAGAIRNDIYQLARKLKQINDGCRSLGLFT